MLPAARTPFSRTLLAVALASCLGSACTTVSVDVPKAPDTPVAFDASTDQTTAQDVSRWWEAIGDSFLTQLIEQGLQSNADVRIAVERVKEARSTVTMAESALFPTFDLVGGASRNRIENSAIGPFGPTAPIAAPIPLPALPAVTIPGNTQFATLAAGGLAATWEVDIFGCVAVTATPPAKRCWACKNANMAPKWPSRLILPAITLKPAASSAGNRCWKPVSQWPNVCSNTLKAALMRARPTVLTWIGHARKSKRSALSGRPCKACCPAVCAGWPYSQAAHLRLLPGCRLRCHSRH